MCYFDVKTLRGVFIPRARFSRPVENRHRDRKCDNFDLQARFLMHPLCDFTSTLPWLRGAVPSSGSCEVAIDSSPDPF